MSTPSFNLDKGTEWLSFTPSLPRLPEPITCARCGCKLRSTNIDHFYDDAFRPVCDPCGYAIEAGRGLSPAPEPASGCWTVAESRETDEYMLKIIGNAGTLTAKQIQEKTGLPKTTLYEKLRRLMLDGKIKRRKLMRKNIYEIAKERGKS